MCGGGEERGWEAIDRVGEEMRFKAREMSEEEGGCGGAVADLLQE